MMNKSQVKGRMNQAAGKGKELAGKAADNKQTEAKGRLQKAAGKAQAGLGDVAEDLKKIR
jgi:uncharacterized protein YjbJ (UPF0337 family)